MLAASIILAGMFVTGFLAGYAVRAYMSHRRREKLRRQSLAHQS
jgi:hypothetical protein